MNDILYELDDPVATITLNRPDTLNALTMPMLVQFREAVDDVQYAALDRVDAREGAAALIEQRQPDFPRHPA